MTNFKDFENYAGKHWKRSLLYGGIGLILIVFAIYAWQNYFFIGIFIDKTYSVLFYPIVYDYTVSDGWIKSLMQFFVLLDKGTKKLCQHDPLNFQNMRLNHVEFDIIFMIISGILLLRSLTHAKSGVMFSKDNKVLHLIRLFAAFGGCIYLIVSFQSQNITFLRWLIGQFRFLTEDFFIFLTLYYVFISLSGSVLHVDVPPLPYPSDKSWIFNLWFSANLLATTFVSVGFWVFIAGFGWYYGLYTFTWFDLLGHFLNLVLVIVEYNQIPQLFFQDCALYLVLFILSCYTTTMYFLQKFGFSCWIPYAPYSTSVMYKMGFIIFIVTLFFIVKRIVK